MDRREFFFRTGMISAALGARNGAELWAQGENRQPKPENALVRLVERDGHVDLSNDALTWRLQWRKRKLASSGFVNKISGRKFTFGAAEEVLLTFSGAAHRVEFPWWKFTYGPDQTATSVDVEQGLAQGFHKPEFDDSQWGSVENVIPRGRPGGKPHGDGITYQGFGWYRRGFELPETARGSELNFVIGGYDHQDWLEYWIYLNGQEIGHRTSSGRWRVPGEFNLKPDHPAYVSLQFGVGAKNLLAIRGRGFDKHFGGLRDDVLRHYVYEPFWADQFIAVGPTYLRISDFEVQQVDQPSSEKAVFDLQNDAAGLRVRLYYELSGVTRRKWLEVENAGDKDLLLLDVQVDDFTCDADVDEGGPGTPVFPGDETFAVFEHPAGLNQGEDGRVRLTQFPGQTLPPGGKWRSNVALVGMAKPGQALAQFTNYLQERTPRKKKALSICTPFGINNQWGACPTLDDEQTLDVLDRLEKFQAQGFKFDYFTLDTGWMDHSADLKRFATQCYPDGSSKVAERIKSLGMNLGLWFSVTGGGWSCAENPAVAPSIIPRAGVEEPASVTHVAYRNGYIANGGVQVSLCPASDPYFQILRDAVLYHIQENGLKFFKLDIGYYYCNSSHHNHLPGKYSVEAMYNHLLDIAAAARRADPDVYVMWYWGVRSPLFALYGDSVFESGLYMEGSATSWFPTLYYRDSVTLNLDQSTQFSTTLPPINKDSLGVWISDIRWGNFMGNERWREAIIMDLGRGNLLFPQIWSDVYLLNDDDVAFLARIQKLVKENESLFLHRRNILGDPWKNEVYGYGNTSDDHGFLFISNVHFAARKVDLVLGKAFGLDLISGTPMEVISHFPDETRIVKADGNRFQADDKIELWMRPFEVLMLEIRTAGADAVNFPPREITAEQAPTMGRSLDLQPTDPTDWMDFRFADAERFEKKGFAKNSRALAATLPEFSGGTHILAIPIKLRQGEYEWLYSPVVAEIAQVVAYIGDQKIQLIPVPDARQYGNTQNKGASWMVYKIRLGSDGSGKQLKFVLQTYLPPDVEADVEAWVVERWWKESARPLGDDYYGDAPS